MRNGISLISKSLSSGVIYFAVDEKAKPLKV
jgi:hypothetical protein